MEQKKTILIVNKEVSQEALKTIADDFRSNKDICMTGYGIEIWEKDLITGELKLLRKDNEKIVKTERIKLGDLEIERPVEKDPLDEIFVEKHKEKPKKKTKNNHIPRNRVKYTPEIIERVQEVVNEKNNQEISDMLRLEFGMNVSKASVANMMWVREINRSKVEEDEAEENEYPEKKTMGRKSIFSQEADEIIEENYEDSIDRDLIDLILKKTGESYTYGQVKARRKKLGFIKPRGFTSRSTKKKYDSEHFEWMREHATEYETLEEMVDCFNKEFNMNISEGALAMQLSINGIKRRRKKVFGEPIKEEESIEIITPEMRRQEEIKKFKRKGMSEKAIEIIEENYMEKTDSELRELIADKIGAFHQTNKIEAYRESNGMARPEGWNPDDFDSDYPEEED